MKLLCKFFSLFALAFLYTFCSISLGSGMAYAHGVYIYAWAGPDEICRDSYFSRKSKVQNGEIQGLAPSGKLLFKARTDDKGRACFPLPDEAMDIEFVVLAGEGHRASFKLRAEDIAPYITSVKGMDSLTEGGMPEVKTIDNLVTDKEDVVVSANNSELLRRIIREELKLQLEPLRQHLFDQEDKSPGLRDVFAGLGWIIALAAIAYIAMRQPSNRN